MKEDINGSRQHLKLVPQPKKETSQKPPPKRISEENVSLLENEIKILNEVLADAKISTRLTNDLKKAMFELGMSHAFITSKLDENNPKMWNDKIVAEKIERSFLDAMKRNGILQHFMNFIKKHSKS